MKSVTINNQKYFFMKFHWDDICGDSTTVGDTDFNKMKCAQIITEGYLYDVFTDNGREYVRSFASYQVGDDYGFGDRNCYPIEVFDDNTKNTIKKLLKLMK